MAAPGVMLRFRDKVDTIDEHNRKFDEQGSVLWGLWLKDFEDRDATLSRLNSKVVDRIYIADTGSKAKPSLYVCDVKRVIAAGGPINDDLIPDYYLSRKAEIPIWFELASRIGEINSDKELVELLGVPTVYFLEYDSLGRVTTSAPQRRYDLKMKEGRRWALVLSDVHLGADHGFRYPCEKQKTDIASQRTLSQVIREDLVELGILDKIACVVIAGDILTKGSWKVSHTVGDDKFTGLQLSKLFLEDFAETVSVDRRHFLMVPGNHDVVRKASGAAQIQEALLHYAHESGFRNLREEFCDVYKLSPLNYVAKLVFDDKAVFVGLLNSAYLNEDTRFSDYGFVGDDAENVFELLDRDDSLLAAKIVILHHHLLPVYEREVVATNRSIPVTLDAVRLLRRAQEIGVSTIVHGHQHTTRRMSFSANSAEMSKKAREEARVVTIVAAGSSGAKRERLPVDETNAYALIDLGAPNPVVRMRRIYPDGRRGEDW